MAKRKDAWRGRTNGRFLMFNGLKTICNMRVTDFEKAIDALGMSGLVNDEVSLRGGQVTRMYAHRGSLLIRWDSMGRAFSTRSVVSLSETKPTEVHRYVPEKAWGREVVYDLKFE